LAGHAQYQVGGSNVLSNLGTLKLLLILWFEEFDALCRKNSL